MKALHAVLLLLGAAFLAWLVSRVGAGEIWRELIALGWGLVPLMFGEGLAEMIHTIGWRHCLSGPLRALRWSFLFRVRMAGYAINYLTPTAAIGGEVTKAALLTPEGNGPEAVSGVLIGNVCFALAHLIFVGLGSALVLCTVNLPPALWLALLASGGLVGGGIVGFLLIQKCGQLGALVRWLAVRRVGGSLLKSAARRATEVDVVMKAFYRDRPADLPKAVAWHLAGYSVGIAQTWLFFRLLRQEASPATAAGAWFLGMWFDLLTFAVPLNLGTLEGTRVVAFKAIGYSSLMGMTYGVATRLAQLFWAGFGLLTYARLASRSGASPKTISASSRPQPGSLSRAGS